MSHPTIDGVVADRFEIRSLAGRGGMGAVYRAYDREGGRDVALKVMHESAGLERFEREGRLLAELDHPAIVDLVTVGQTQDGVSYVAMEWLEGTTLHARLHGAGLSIPNRCGVSCPSTPVRTSSRWAA